MRNIRTLRFPDDSNVSQEARSFVSMLLTSDPSLRMPLHMAMKHPFTNLNSNLDER